MSKKLFSSILLASMLAGMSAYSLNSSEYYSEQHLPTRCKSREEIPGREHTGKSQSKLEYKKLLERKRKLRKRKGHKHGGAKK